MTKFVHDYAISFVVHTTEPDPYKVEGRVLREALISAHSTLTDEEMIEAVDHIQTMPVYWDTTDSERKE
mgnify:CR=1 FL=1|tara:strand:- start:6316 stop:6522 length:207 start_codon:yes stop_codon:yes gene_type:complete